ncbi:MAG: hypothetical protein RLZZ204_1071 [Bacteroidota bacterium]|jgi:uncharacterized membrane protein
MKIRHIFTLLAIAAIASCTHEVINAPTDPTSPIDVGGGGGTTPNTSDTVCFNTEVLPLYVSYCGSSGCHDAGSRQEGVITTSYTRIMEGIRAKNASRSEYYTIIGGEMPPAGSPQLSTAQKNVILKWINQGALNTNCINSCDTTKFTFNDPIKTLLTNNCLGCHGTKPGSGNVYLGDYASAKAYIEANPTNFLKVINHDPSIAASKRMPPAGKMVDCQIGQFSKWVNNGFPQ